MTRKPFDSSAGRASIPLNSKTLSTLGSPIAGIFFSSARAFGKGNALSAASKSPFGLRRRDARDDAPAFDTLPRVHPAALAMSASTAAFARKIASGRKPTRAANSSNNAARRSSSIQISDVIPQDERDRIIEHARRLVNLGERCDDGAKFAQATARQALGVAPLTACIARVMCA